MTLRLIVAAILTERLESAIVFGGKTREMLVDVVAVVSQINEFARPASTK